MPPETEISIVRLARLALDTLDAQQRYFKHRAPEDLIQSKTLEQRLRVYSKACLAEWEPAKE